ncbi:hypothetical protein WMY93_009229 [Mugilogobius chulae]|uniref:Uncharacterized protein n=1 Tax=Mugilogobius chulae TaxID=88201 RepID=A0AAW0PM13_9GOBI
MLAKCIPATKKSLESKAVRSLAANLLVCIHLPRTKTIHPPAQLRSRQVRHLSSSAYEMEQLIEWGRHVVDARRVNQTVVSLRPDYTPSTEIRGVTSERMQKGNEVTRYSDSCHSRYKI